MKRFSDLTEQEVLALAITNEEEDSRIYRGFAEGLRDQFPASAKIFDEMADEEVTHRTMLFDLSLVEARCASHPLALVTPREHARRGSHVSFTHPHGYAVMQSLIERGVIGDYREPEIMRFGFTPLYTSYADVWDAVEILRDILDSGSYDLDAARSAVT